MAEAATGLEVSDTVRGFDSHADGRGTPEDSPGGSPPAPARRPHRHGKHGARRADRRTQRRTARRTASTGRPARPHRPHLLRRVLLALGATVCVVAWGYLVRAAIDFGGAARDGQSSAWGLLALACLGAAACLFIGLIVGARLFESFADPDGVTRQAPPRTRGGRRARR